MTELVIEYNIDLGAGKMYARPRIIPGQPMVTLKILEMARESVITDQLQQEIRKVVMPPVVLGVN